MRLVVIREISALSESLKHRIVRTNKLNYQNVFRQQTRTLEHFRNGESIGDYHMVRDC